MTQNELREKLRDIGWVLVGRHFGILGKCIFARRRSDGLVMGVSLDWKMVKKDGAEWRGYNAMLQSAADRLWEVINGLS